MVSIVLVTYNRSAHLRSAINDILSQTFSDFELIICDDCSTDNTKDVISEFKDQRIKYFINEVNIGMPGNLINGLNQAQYDYIAILHDGDRFQLNLIQRWYDAIIQNPNVGVVFNPLMVFDSFNNKSFGPHLFKEGVLNGRYLLKKYYFSNYLFPSLIWGEAMINRNLLKNSNYLEFKYGFYADVDLWISILKENDAYYCSEHLIHCPSKEFVPNLFDNRLIKSSFILMDIHYKHRIDFYNNKKLDILNFIFFIFQCILNYIHINLIIQKNNSLQILFNAGGFTIKNKPYFFPIWILLLPLKIIFITINSFKKLHKKYIKINL